MEQFVYQRPREKMRATGTATLSNVELIQLILGSGTKGVTAGRIARQVDMRLQAKDLSYKTLTAIHGIGDAKACQLLAALELARRHL